MTDTICYASLVRSYQCVDMNKPFQRAEKKGLSRLVYQHICEDLIKRVDVLKKNTQHCLLVDTNLCFEVDKKHLDARQYSHLDIKHLASKNATIKYLNYQSVDCVIAPLVSSSQLNGCIKSVRKILSNQGGWWLFASLLDGSYHELGLTHEPNQDNQSITAKLIIDQLAANGLTQPILDCSCLRLGYTERIHAITDYQALSKIKVAPDVKAQDKKCTIDQQHSFYCTAELGFCSVYISRNARSSMQELQTKVIMMHDT